MVSQSRLTLRLLRLEVVGLRSDLSRDKVPPTLIDVLRHAGLRGGSTGSITDQNIYTNDDVSEINS